MFQATQQSFHGDLICDLLLICDWDLSVIERSNNSRPFPRRNGVMFAGL